MKKLTTEKFVLIAIVLIGALMFGYSALKGAKTRTITDHYLKVGDSSKVLTFKLSVSRTQEAAYLTIRQVEKLRSQKLDSVTFKNTCDSIEGGAMILLQSQEPLKDTTYN